MISNKKEITQYCGLISIFHASTVKERTVLTSDEFKFNNFTAVSTIKHIKLDIVFLKVVTQMSESLSSAIKIRLHLARGER